MSTCPPNKPALDEAAIAALIQLNPCAALPELRVAYYKAIAGTKRSHVSFRERSTQYQSASPAFLLREISKLERMCFDPVRNPNPCAQAVQATGVSPNGPGYPSGIGILPAGFLSRYR
jgi:hypothetical protein